MSATLDRRRLLVVPLVLAAILLVVAVRSGDRRGSSDGLQPVHDVDATRVVDEPLLEPARTAAHPSAEVEARVERRSIAREPHVRPSPDEALPAEVPDCAVRVLVRDAATDEPLAGARILRDDVVIARSDAEGVALVAADQKGDDARFEVERHGYARALVGIEDEPCDTEVRVELDAGAVIRGRFLGLDDGELPGVIARVDSHHLLRPRGVYPHSGDDADWSVIVDDDGRFELRDLPPDVPLELVRLSDDPFPRRLHDRLLVLAAGSVTELTFDWEASSAVFGTVVDEGGRTVAGIRVDCVRRPEWHLVTTTTDASGVFRFGELRPGEYLIRLGPNEGDRISRDRTVRLPRGETRAADLVAVPAAYISGRVLGEDGRPLRSEGVWPSYVHVLALNEHGPTSGPCDEDGRFRLGPLVPGRYMLSCGGTTNSLRAPPESVEIDAPSSGVEIRWVPAGDVRVRVTDEAGAVVSAVVVLHEWSGREHYVTNPRSSGPPYFGGVRPGAHTVIATARDGRVGVAHDVRVRSRETTTTVVRVRDSGELVVGRPSAGGEYAQVRVQGMVLRGGDRLHGDRRRFRVPPGPLVVERCISDWTDGAHSTRVLEAREVIVRAGERTDVDFD